MSVIIDLLDLVLQDEELLLDVLGFFTTHCGILLTDISLFSEGDIEFSDQFVLSSKFLELISLGLCKLLCVS